MKIYSFWSGDTTYFTKYKGLKKAQEVGRENMESYKERCRYIGEEPQADRDYFIPRKGEINEETADWFRHLVNTDPDITILDDELHDLI